MNEGKNDIDTLALRLAAKAERAIALSLKTAADGNGNTYGDLEVEKIPAGHGHYRVAVLAKNANGNGAADTALAFDIDTRAGRVAFGDESESLSDFEAMLTRACKAARELKGSTQPR